MSIDEIRTLLAEVQKDAIRAYHAKHGSFPDQDAVYNLKLSADVVRGLRRHGYMPDPETHYEVAGMKVVHKDADTTHVVIVEPGKKGV